MNFTQIFLKEAEKYYEWKEALDFIKQNSKVQKIASVYYNYFILEIPQINLEESKKISKYS